MPGKTDGEEDPGWTCGFSGICTASPLYCPGLTGLELGGLVDSSLEGWCGVGHPVDSEFIHHLAHIHEAL